MEEKSRIEELRRWAAEDLLGLTLKDNNYMVPDEKPGHWRVLFLKPDFRPDDPATGQIWLVVEAMRELGWVLCLNGYTAWFMRPTCFTMPPTTETHVNICRAILRAAKAAWGDGR